MSSSYTTPLTAITVDDGSADAKEKGIAVPASSAPPAPAAPPVTSALPPPPARPAPPAATPRRFPFAGLFRRDAKSPSGGRKRGLAIIDFFIRLFAIAALTAAAGAMGTAEETLPFVTNAFQFHANFADLPALLFLVIADAIAAGYLVFSIPLAIISIIRPTAVCPRLTLLIFDLVAVALTTAAGSAAAAIVYLAHSGNSKANWVAICNRFQDFCEQTSGAVVASMVGTVLLLLMVIISALLLPRR